jgi:hypothetical protein
MTDLNRIPQFITGLLVLMTCLFSAQISAYPVDMPKRAAPESEQQALQHWQAVLKTFVNENGQVDFKTLQARPDDLEAYIAWVALYSPHTHPEMFKSKEIALAFYLNSYNALSMYNVLADDLPDNLGGFTKVDFFYLREVQVGGKRISLYDYENDVIRPLGDPRIHFALNCMAVSCPQLPMEPFQADSLNAELDTETRKFFSEPRNLKIDHDTKSIQLSELIDFYSEDFLAKAPNLIAYMNRYLDTPIPEDYEIEYISYNWRVNQQP